jgi:serine/threonine protein phosphatase 1
LSRSAEGSFAVRYLAIGDIHGCYQALTALARAVEFAPDDVIITLGDYVDRGPNSFAVLDWLIDLQRRHFLVPLRGNHEVMLLRARDSREKLAHWRDQGGAATLASYAHFDDGGSLADIPEHHWQFLEEDTHRYFETDEHFFVHAGVYPEEPLDQQPDFMLFWHRFTDPGLHYSGRTMICGHTAQASGRPLSLGHAVCIDTFAHGGKWLTCLDVESGKYWQANEAGETRWNYLRRQRHAA